MAVALAKWRWKSIACKNKPRAAEASEYASDSAKAGVDVHTAEISALALTILLFKYQNSISELNKIFHFLIKERRKFY